MGRNQEGGTIRCRGRYRYRNRKTEKRGTGRFTTEATEAQRRGGKGNEVRAPDDIHLDGRQHSRYIGPGQMEPEEYRNLAEHIRKSIMEICSKPSNDPGIQHIQDIFRLNEHQLFHWVNNPDIPCENNFAERNLRPVVISRRTSFGCQSGRGMRTREILMTILHTAKYRGHDPATFLENALNVLTLNPKADLTQLLFPDATSLQNVA